MDEYLFPCLPSPLERYREAIEAEEHLIFIWIQFQSSDFEKRSHEETLSP